MRKIRRDYTSKLLSQQSGGKSTPTKSKRTSCLATDDQKTQRRTSAAAAMASQSFPLHNSCNIVRLRANLPLLISLFFFCVVTIIFLGMSSFRQVSAYSPPNNVSLQETTNPTGYPAWVDILNRAGAPAPFPVPLVNSGQETRNQHLQANYEAGLGIADSFTFGATSNTLSALSAPAVNDKKLNSPYGIANTTANVLNLYNLARSLPGLAKSAKNIGAVCNELWDNLSVGNIPNLFGKNVANLTPGEIMQGYPVLPSRSQLPYDEVYALAQKFNKGQFDPALWGEPIKVYRFGDGTFVLVNGHKRLTAIEWALKMGGGRGNFPNLQSPGLFQIDEAVGQPVTSFPWSDVIWYK
jgi:hypothetical protein